MMHDGNDSVLLSLANILRGNRVEAVQIEKALSFIGELSGFHSRAVYEINLSGSFSLMEHFTSGGVIFPKRLDVETFLQPDAKVLAEENVYYITRQCEYSAYKLQLLDLFSAQSIVLAPVLDEDSSFYGFIMLLDPVQGQACDEALTDTISVALSMLVHYIKHRMYQRKLQQTKTTMESILDNTGIDIYVNDFYTHEILYVNQSMAAPYGGKEQFMGNKCWETLFPDTGGPCDFCPQSKLLDDGGRPSKVYTWDYQRAFDGSWFRVFSAAFQWVDGRLAHVVSSADITENKRYEALIESMANYDELTKLPNRRMLIKECDRRIDKATALEQGYLLFFDIDGFKAINDNFGHDAGDEFLVQLGAFFSNIPLLKDAIYRNGGDEFVALVGGETVTKANVQSLANFILERFKKPWILNKGQVVCSTSIGVACYPEDGVTTEVLLQKADMAMYQVKKSGGSGLCFGYQLKTPSE